jgi:large subunit ribosomal protein L32e
MTNKRIPHTPNICLSKTIRLKKHVKKFRRSQSERKAGSIKSNWRRPKGIDCAVRRRFKGKTLLPNIGYASNKQTRHKLKNGFLKFTVRNKNEIQLLALQHQTHLAEIAHKVSARKRKELLTRASLLKIGVL